VESGLGQKMSQMRKTTEDEDGGVGRGVTNRQIGTRTQRSKQGAGSKDKV